MILFLLLACFGSHLDFDACTAACPPPLVVEGVMVDIDGDVICTCKITLKRVQDPAG
jgi:hypothetical protein